MKALLIEVNFETGERAGGINPRDPGLRGNPEWQNLDSRPGKEIRVITDGRTLSAYADVKGVTVLDGKEAINAAIQANFPAKASVIDMQLLLAHANEKGIKLSAFAGLTADGIAAEALKLGLAGVVESKPRLLE